MAPTLEEIGWVYVKKMKELKELYQGRQFNKAYDMTRAALRMPRLPEYMRAQFLLLNAVLGGKPAINADSAVSILHNLFLAAGNMSKERDKAFKECMVVAEEYRFAVSGTPEKQVRTTEAEYLIKEFRKVKKSRLWIEHVTKVMLWGEQFERGDLLLDAHARLFEVVVTEIENSIRVLEIT